MLYFYEAMILVLASCLLGVMVGMIVGYTMTLTPQHGPGMRAKWLDHVREGNLKMEWKIPDSFPAAVQLNNATYLENRLQSRPTE